jgi:hypothetical protein
MSRGRFLLGGALVAATFSTVAIAPTTAHTGDPAPSARRFARAAWTPDGTVRAITLTKQRVYIAGDFTHLRSVATGKVVRRTRVAAFRRDNGTLVRGFQPTANGSVDAMAVLGHKLFLGGDFTAVNRVDRQHLAAVNRRTGGLTSITAEVDGPVWTLLAMQGSVYVGGDFEHVDGLLRTHLFALDASGVLSSTWPDQAAGTTKGGVYTLAATANQRSVIVGGGFTKLVGQPRTYLGEISRATGDVRAWNPTPACFPGHCFVRSLVADRTRIYAGIAGPGGHVAAYARSSARTVWIRHTNGDVTAIALAGRRVVIGGHFTEVSQKSRRIFAELGTRTGTLAPRQVNSSGDVYPGILAIDVTRGRIRIGGSFDTLASQGRYAILRE